MAWTHTKTRQQRGYGAEWDRTRKRILDRDNRLCQPCLKLDFLHPADEVDHVVPKAEGGTDDDDNLQAINGDCHKRKTAEEAARAQGRILAADSASRAQFYSSLGQNGVMTRNEMRAKENLAPLAGGDILTVQSNLVPLDQLGLAPADAQGARDALLKWLGEGTIGQSHTFRT